MPVQRDEAIRSILGIGEVAVVGCSGTPGKDAHEVPRYLLDHGYDVRPVNPNRDAVFGRTTADSLSDLEPSVGLVNVFRPSEEVAGIVDRAIDRNDVQAIWTQLGIHDDAAARRAERSGLDVVQDRCIKVEHRRLL